MTQNRHYHYGINGQPWKLWKIGEQNGKNWNAYNTKLKSYPLPSQRYLSPALAHKYVFSVLTYFMHLTIATWEQRICTTSTQNRQPKTENETESGVLNLESRFPAKSKRIYDYKKWKNNDNNKFCIIYAFNVNRQFKGTTRRWKN